MDERAREAISDQLLEIAGDEFTLAQVRGELTDTVIAALDAAGYAIVPKELNLEMRRAEIIGTEVSSRSVYLTPARPWNSPRGSRQATDTWRR